MWGKENSLKTQIPLLEIHTKQQREHVNTFAEQEAPLLV